MEAPGEHGVDAGFWAARRGGQVVAAMRVSVQPSRTATITAPRLADGEAPSVAVAIVAAVVEALGARGVRRVQALLETDREADARRLEAAGFHHVADLLYLVSMAAAFPQSPPAAHLEYVPYSPQCHQRLVETIARTYEGSLDCPAAGAVRDLDDVLADYRAGGVFDPARWLLVTEAGQDIGCLLLADQPADNQWELVYLGIVPEARGRALGLALVRHAQWLARLAGRGRLVLAVDAENGPAARRLRGGGIHPLEPPQHLSALALSGE